MAPLHILIISNGQGEDAIGARLAGELERQRPGAITLDAWALVGAGDAYRAIGISVVGPGNHLPSEGFGTLSLRAFADDLRHGWLSVHHDQLRAALARRGRYDLAIAIGDIVPLACAAASRVPFVFVGCAYSAYYGRGNGYGALDRWLLRRALCCYPRDPLTATLLEASGIRVRALGNPMMDEVGCAPDDATRDPELTLCLPGSRRDGVDNAARMLGFLIREHDRLAEAGLRRFAFALPRRFPCDALRDHARRDDMLRRWDWSTPEPSCPQTMHTASYGSLRASFAQGSLSHYVHRARVALGVAGTANEQAVGGGVPLVTFSTNGVQGDAFLRMKMPYFGESALQVPPDASAIATALVAIARDPLRHGAMAAAGRARMGPPGATTAIVQDVLARMDERA